MESGTSAPFPATLLSQAFLSHCRQEQDLVQILGSELRRSGLPYFSSAERDTGCEMGRQFSDCLITNVDRSRVVVLVLSETFFKRKWCIIELVRSFDGYHHDSCKVLLPVFYGWSPEAASRWLRALPTAGPEQQVLAGQIQQWAATQTSDCSSWDGTCEKLQQVFSMQGVSCMAIPGDEVPSAAVMQKLVEQEIVPVIRKHNSSQFFPEHNIAGTDIWVNQALVRLERSGRLGIIGTGGVGKSTLTQLLYNRLFTLFDGRVVHIEVKQLPGDHHMHEAHLKEFQTKMLRCLLKLTDNDVNKLEILSSLQGSELLCRRLGELGSRFLIILDDLWEEQDVDCLLPPGIRNLFSPAGSWVVLSGRNVRPLTPLRTHDAPELQLVNLEQDYHLTRQQQLDLLGLHACPTEELSTDDKDLIVSLCHNVPLKLKLLGKAVQHASRNSEQHGLLEQLRRQRIHPESDELDAVYSSSYNALRNPALRAAFLDIALYFPANQAKQVIDSWCRVINSSVPYDCVRQLADRCLVTWHGQPDSPVGVHDALREFAAQYLFTLSCSNPGASSPLEARYFWQLSHTQDASYIPTAAVRVGAASVKQRLAEQLVEQLNSPAAALDLARHKVVLTLTESPDDCTISSLVLSGYSRLHLLNLATFGVRELQLEDLPRLQILLAHHNKLSVCPSFDKLVALRYLDLSFNQLSGQLSSQWSELINLQHVNLRRNKLQGQLPQQLSALVNLQVLHADHNRLSGSLPTQWSALANLRVLNLGYNNLSGQLPQQWSALVNLQKLSLGLNHLCGQLPPQWSTLVNLRELSLHQHFKSERRLSGQLPCQWSAMRNLQLLDLAGNSLTGQMPEQWSTLSNLQELNLAHNQLTGTLPEQWSALVSLQSLKFSNNQLSGQLPQRWSSLQKLTHLDLYSNQLSGQLPEQWSALVNLQSLRLHFNQLSGQLPQEWSALSGLAALCLAGNQLSGKLPQQWSSLQKLTYLSLYDNQLSGQLPEQWSALVSLKDLSLSRNQLSGQLPQGWSALSGLAWLDLNGNQLSGQLPQGWSALSGLAYLHLAGNQLSGQLPQQWSSMQNLSCLNLFHNQLSGQLPGQWSELVSLKSLDLGRNQLSGQLPQEWPALSDLTSLDLSSNQLSGQLPQQYASLQRLRGLRIYNNHLSGQLPEQWSELVSLERLSLAGNQLSGQLPQGWSALSGLASLDLERNQLSGQLPQQWSSLQKLTYLYLSSNMLSGQLPAQWSVLTNLWLLDLDTQHLSEELVKRRHKYGYVRDPFR